MTTSSWGERARQKILIRQVFDSLERLESQVLTVLRDLKVTHPSLERLESDSSKSRET